MNAIIIQITKYFLLFICYSFDGWIIETINCSIRERKFSNRGFLLGPICPVYGFGGVFITILLTRYYSSVPVVFVMSIVLCAIWEYFTSWSMEKIIKARWWDYSNDKLNLNGRICIRTLIPFGILGLFIVYGIDPLLKNAFEHINIEILNVIALLFLILFIIDILLSASIIKKVTHTAIKIISKSPRDNTQEIKEKVRQELKNVFGARRLLNAFPDFEIIKEKIKIAIYEAKEKIDKAAEENEERIENIKKKSKENIKIIKNKSRGTIEKRRKDYKK